jgi:hypothetical protein
MLTSLDNLPFSNSKSAVFGRVPKLRKGSGCPLYLFCPKAKKDAAAIPHAALSSNVIVMNSFEEFRGNLFLRFSLLQSFFFR